MAAGDGMVASKGGAGRSKEQGVTRMQEEKEEDAIDIGVWSWYR